MHELPWGRLASKWDQTFPCTTTITGDHFEPKMRKFGHGLVGDVVSMKFVTSGRSYKDPSRVLKNDHAKAWAISRYEWRTLTFEETTTARINIGIWKARNPVLYILSNI